MKIGIDARNLISTRTGIGRYVFESCRALSEAGHQLHLYIPEPLPSVLEFPKPVVYRIANQAGAVRRVLWGEFALGQLAARDELDIFWGPAHRLPRFLNPATARVVTIHDLVWVHHAKTMRTMNWLAERWLMKPALQRADEIISVSQATRIAVEDHFPFTAGRTTVIYPGLTALPEAQANDVLTGNDIDRPYALFVGTIEPRKNLWALLEAYSQVPTAIRERLLLVIAGGQGWGLGDIKEQIARLGLTANIRLTGFVSDEDLAALYRNARFLAMPSLYEGFGFPIIEANSAGVPAMTSTLSSMPEVAGEAAVLIDPANRESLRDGLIKLATDDSLHARLSSKALSNASRFDWKNTADELVAAFTRAIETRRRQAR